MENSWRNSVTIDSRTKIVKRIMDTLQRHFPVARQDGVDNLLKMAWQYEEKSFLAAIDQQVYVRKLAIKMLALETKANPPQNRHPPGAQVAAPGAMMQVDEPAAMAMPDPAQTLGNGVRLSEQQLLQLQQQQQEQQLLAQYGVVINEHEAEVDKNETEEDKPLSKLNINMKCQLPTLSMDNSWRNSVTIDSRTKIVKRIMDTLQRHMPIAGEDGADELLKIAWRFEEKSFQAATDQQDYLRKIAIKMLSVEAWGEENGVVINELDAEVDKRLSKLNINESIGSCSQTRAKRD